jgi:hypothetical protein
MPRISAFVSAPLIACAILAAPLLPPPPANAAEPPAYLDNRSTPASLIRSLYNAVNRKEYARAYGYFHNDPATPSFDDFTAGYKTTASVDLAVGKVEQEGAAGSILSRVPVAIRAHMDDGTSKTFAGCYWLRLAQPTIQTPPFTPLHIEKAKLSAASGSGALAGQVPGSCPES